MPVHSSALRLQPCRLAALAFFGVVVIYWCQLFYPLQIEWTANEQYGYGWFVPLLAAGLFCRRWLDRPLPEDYRTTDHGPQTTDLRLLTSVFCLLLFLLFPLRLIHEANIGWRSAQWLHAVILVILSLLLLWRLGGWSYVRHFWFPVVFLLVAVPWPNRIEAPAVQELRRLVAGASVELLGLFGVPTFQRGSLIEISSGVVSVDGACSGVRSLQTGMMLALMLGELFRLTPWRRISLVSAGFAIAIVANVSRTSFLTWSAAKQGFVQMESWHGPAGIAVVVLVLGGLWLTAWLLSRRPLSSDISSLPSALSSQLSAISPQEASSSPISHLPSSAASPLTSDLRPLISGRWLLAALAWLLCIEASNAVWFRLGDQRSQQNPAWSINWPTNALNYREIPLKEIEQEMLRYDSARNTAWQDEAGNQWSLIALHWAAGNKNSFIGRGHTPDQCFVGAGYRLRTEPSPVRLVVNGINLPFRRYTFDVDGKTAYVFLTLWDERSPGGQQELSLAYGISRRLKAALDGKRHQGLKKLEISLIGPSNPDEALTILQQGLEKLLVVEESPAAKAKSPAGESSD